MFRQFYLTVNRLGAIEVFRDITLEQEVDRMKSEFISLASHQLRTPLSAIKTYTHMLFDGYMGELNDAQKTFAQHDHRRFEPYE